MKDEFYMQLALNKAWKYQILTYPNPAVGALILDENNEILSIKAHKKAGLMHAEVSAILFALFKKDESILQKFISTYNQHNTQHIFSREDIKYKDINPIFTYKFIENNHQNLLKNSTIFITLEPCTTFGKTPPCINLILNLNFKKVVISSKDPTLKTSGIEILKDKNINVITGILQKKGDDLLYPFLKWRHSKNFVFFKIATTINGVVSGKITSRKSLELVHKIREIIDILVIGGNTVRIDRPTLDCRFTNIKKAPNIMILSQNNHFDKNIPLFNVTKRNVEITNDANKITNSGLVMIEGGENMLNSIIDKIDLMLIFNANRFERKTNLKAEVSLEKIFEHDIGNNTYGWYKILR